MQFKSLGEEILKEESYLKEIISLHDKYYLSDLTDFLGFLTAVHLNGKSGDEVNQFFGLQNDLTEKEILEFKSIVKLLKMEL